MFFTLNQKIQRSTNNTTSYSIDVLILKSNYYKLSRDSKTVNRYNVQTKRQWSSGLLPEKCLKIRIVITEQRIQTNLH